jgi:chromosome partitioning protein
MRRIAIINQKGGVGKTTTTVNVGMGLARAGNRVLLIDLDPQAHLSLHLGIDPAAGRPGVYEMLTANASVAKARVKVASNLWMVSSSIDLAGAEVELVSVVGREVILRDLLEQHVKANTAPYDYILFDCPPSLGVLTLNALCAAQEVFIPLQPHYLALQGLGKLLETITLVGKRINPGLIVGGVIVCLQDAGTKLGAEVLDDVRSFFSNDRNKPVAWSGARVFNSVIRRNIKLAESPSYGKSIFDYAPDSNGAKDYENLVSEIMGVPLEEAKPAMAETPAPHPVTAEMPVVEAKPPVQSGSSVVKTNPVPPKPAVARPVKAVPPHKPAAQQSVALKPAEVKPAAPRPAATKPQAPPSEPPATRVAAMKPANAPTVAAKPAAAAKPAPPAVTIPEPAAANVAPVKPAPPKSAAVKPVKSTPPTVPVEIVAASSPAEKSETSRPLRIRKKTAAVAQTPSASIEKTPDVVVSPVATAIVEMPVPTPPHEPPAVTFSVVFAEPQTVTPAPSRPARSKKTA